MKPVAHQKVRPGQLWHAVADNGDFVLFVVIEPGEQLNTWVTYDVSNIGGDSCCMWDTCWDEPGRSDHSFESFTLLSEIAS